MRLFFFASLLLLFLNTDSFEFYHQKAIEDYDNGITNSTNVDKAIELCTDIKRYPDLLLFKGINLFYSNKILLAIKYLELAKNYTNKPKDLLLITNNLGLLYSQLGRLKKGNHYFRENIARANTLENVYYKNEGEFNILLNNYDGNDNKTSIKDFWFFYNNLINKTEIEKIEYLNIFFEINNDQNNLKDATLLRNYILQNFNIYNVEKKYLGYYYFNNATLYKKLKNYSKAISYTDSSYFISKKHLTKEEELEDFYNYKEIYEKQKEYQIALKYVDSINIIETLFDENKLESSLKIVDENILFNNTKKKLDKTINNYKKYIIISIVLFFIILITLHLNRKKINLKLRGLKNELEISKGKYNKTVKENIDFKKELKIHLKNNDINSLVKLQQKKDINDINEQTYINYLESNIDKQFLKKLNKFNFSFTDIEKLLIYYRKNENTYKEIALITGKTLRSVQSLSYRLNKKIDQHLQMSLTDFIKNF